IAVVHAVRATVGPNCPLMLDAHNGYNLNLAKRVLLETRDADIFWLEEAFHEDVVLYRDLREWMAAQGLSVRIADGEGQASPSLLAWAREGVVDVVQYDIFSYGFTRWLALARQLDEWGVYTAPHHYGGHVGNHVSTHLAAAVERFAFVEWDEASTPGLDASAYVVEEGQVHVPAAPGFGLELDLERFAHAVRQGGFTATA
ncbi:mandelate racemase, partial [Litorilinea aerophila]